jgi:hypothetical protein
VPEAAELAGAETEDQVLDVSACSTGGAEVTDPGAAVAQDRTDRQRDYQRRVEPEQPAYIEATKLDRARACLLTEQDRGDQVPRQDEEDVYPEPAPLPQLQVGVERDHSEDRDRTDAVKFRSVFHVRTMTQSGRSGGGVPHQHHRWTSAPRLPQMPDR